MRKRDLARAAAAIVGSLLGSVSVSSADTSADWLNSVNGNWTDPTNWSTNPVFPNNGQPAASDTYSVLIDAAGAPYTVTFNVSSLISPTVIVNSVTLNSPDATLLATGGTLSATGGLNVTQGIFRLQGATLSDMALSGTGQISLTSGVLDQVTLSTSATTKSNGGIPLWVQNGLTLNNGTLAVNYFSAAGDSISSVGFRGTQTIGGTGQLLFQGDRFSNVYVQGTLTVGANVTVRGAADFWVYGSNVINNGQFIVDNPAVVDSFTPDLPTDTFINHGLIRATNGARISLNMNFDNSGGTIVADGGEVDLGYGSQGAIPYPTAALGTLRSLNGGVIALGGYLDNSNATLRADANTGNLHVGSVTGGRMETADNAAFIVGGHCNLNSTTLAGTIQVSSFLYDNTINGSVLNVHDLTLEDATIILSGSANPQGSVALSADTKSETISGTGQILLTTSSNNWINGGLTLGPGITVRTVGGSGMIGYYNMPITSQGAIIADGQPLTLWTVTNLGRVQAINAGTLTTTDLTNRGSLRLNQANASFDGNWTNEGGQIQAANGSVLTVLASPADWGSISLTDSTLNLNSAITSTQFKNSLSLTRSTVNLNNGAVLTATGDTITLPDGDTIQFQGGTGEIVGGTLAGSSTDALVVAGQYRGTVDSVTLAIPTTIQSGGWLTALNSLTLSNSTITLVGGGNYSTQLNLPATLGGTGTILFNGNKPDIVAAGSNSFSLGPGIVIQSGTMGGSVTGTLVTNQGRISSQTAGQTITVGNAILNQGVLEANNGGLLVLNGLTNQGTASVSGGGVMSLAGSWSNGGQITVTSATLNLGGSFTTSGLGSIKNTGGTVNITGTLLNSGSTLTLDDTTGSWNLAGGRIFRGTVLTSGLAKLVVASGPTGTLQEITIKGSLNLQNDVSVIGGLTLAADALSGGGQLNLSGSGTTNFIRPIATTLHLPSGITVTNVDGSPSVGIAGGNILNEGLISSRVSGQTITLQGSVENRGTIEARNGGSIAVADPAHVLSYGTLTGGTWAVYGGSGITMTGGSITTNSAAIVLSGSTSQFPALAPLAINNGVLQLLARRNFTASGPFSNFGTLSEGGGVETFLAPQFTQGSSGTLGLELDGWPLSNQFDRVTVTGNAALDGTLSLSFANGYLPNVGDTFQILSAGNLTGQFSSVTWPQQPDGGQFIPTYTPTGVLVTYVPEPSFVGLLALSATGLLLRRRGAGRNLA